MPKFLRAIQNRLNSDPGAMQRLNNIAQAGIIGNSGGNYGTALLEIREKQAREKFERDRLDVMDRRYAEQNSGRRAQLAIQQSQENRRLDEARKKQEATILKNTAMGKLAGVEDQDERLSIMANSNVPEMVWEAMTRQLDAGKKVKPSVRSIKKAAIMEQGYGESYADNFVDGNIETTIDDGVITVLNKLDGTATQTRIQDLQDVASGKATIETLPGGTIWSAMQDAAGPLAAIRVGGSVLAAAINEIPGINIPIAKVTIKAKQMISTHTLSLTKVLSKNKRYPEGERRWILDELANIAPSIFLGPTYMEPKLDALDEALTAFRSYAESDMKDFSLSKGDREDARAMTKEIDRFLTVLGVPREGDIEGDIEGEIMEDAQGNRARVLNGQVVELL